MLIWADPGHLTVHTSVYILLPSKWQLNEGSAGMRPTGNISLWTTLSVALQKSRSTTRWRTPGLKTSHPIQHTQRRSHYAGLAVAFLQLLGLRGLEGGAIRSMLTGPAGVSGGF